MKDPDNADEWHRYDIKESTCTECEDYSGNTPNEICFEFVADCQGDSIALCEKHLTRALELLRDAKNKKEDEEE